MVKYDKANVWTADISKRLDTSYNMNKHNLARVAKGEPTCFIFTHTVHSIHAYNVSYLFSLNFWMYSNLGVNIPLDVITALNEINIMYQSTNTKYKFIYSLKPASNSDRQTDQVKH